MADHNGRQVVGENGRRLVLAQQGKNALFNSEGDSCCCGAPAVTAACQEDKFHGEYIPRCVTWYPGPEWETESAVINTHRGSSIFAKKKGNLLVTLNEGSINSPDIWLWDGYIYRIGMTPFFTWDSEVGSFEMFADVRINGGHSNRKLNGDGQYNSGQYPAAIRPSDTVHSDSMFGSFEIRNRNRQQHYYYQDPFREGKFISFAGNQDVKQECTCKDVTAYVPDEVGAITEVLAEELTGDYFVNQWQSGEYANNYNDNKNRHTIGPVAKGLCAFNGLQVDNGQFHFSRNREYGMTGTYRGWEVRFWEDGDATTTPTPAVPLTTWYRATRTSFEKPIAYDRDNIIALSYTVNIKNHEILPGQEAAVDHAGSESVFSDSGGGPWGNWFPSAELFNQDEGRFVSANQGGLGSNSAVNGGADHTTRCWHTVYNNPDALFDINTATSKEHNPGERVACIPAGDYIIQQVFTFLRDHNDPEDKCDRLHVWRVDTFWNGQLMHCKEILVENRLGKGLGGKRSGNFPYYQVERDVSLISGGSTTLQIHGGNWGTITGNPMISEWPFRTVTSVPALRSPLATGIKRVIVTSGPRVAGRDSCDQEALIGSYDDWRPSGGTNWVLTPQTAYHFPLTLYGGLKRDPVWFCLEGAPPIGLSWDSATGNLLGRTFGDGTEQNGRFTTKWTDANARQCSTTINWRVNAPPLGTLTLNYPDEFFWNNLHEDDPISVEPEIGAPGPYGEYYSRYVITSGSLPAGVGLLWFEGTIVGTPTTFSSGTVTIELTETYPTVRTASTTINWGVAIPGP